MLTVFSLILACSGATNVEIYKHKPTESMVIVENGVCAKVVFNYDYFTNYPEHPIWKSHAPYVKKIGCPEGTLSDLRPVLWNDKAYSVKLPFKAELRRLVMNFTDDTASLETEKKYFFPEGEGDAHVEIERTPLECEPQDVR